MLEIIESYNKLKSHLPQLLDISGYRLDYIAENLGFSKNYFYNKKSKNKFSNEEFEKIIKFIWRQDLEDKIFLIMMKESEESGKIGEKNAINLMNQLAQ